MNTLELTKLINSARKECQVNDIKHYTLLIKCRHFFSGDLKEGSYKAGKRFFPYYDLTSDQVNHLIKCESEKVMTILEQLHQPADKVAEKGLNELICTEVKTSMTSLEVLNLINQFRYLECRSEMRHGDLLAIIRDEFEEEIDQRNIPLIFFYDSMNRKQPMYQLTFNQVRCLLVRESKAVRKRMIKYISDLEENNHLLLVKQYATNKELLQAKEALLLKESNEADYWYDRAEKLEADNIKLKKGLPVISNQIPEDYEFLRSFYQMTTLTPQYASIPAVKAMYGLRDSDISIDNLMQYSSFKGLPIEKVVNPATGRIVNAYHVIAWSETHGVSF